MSRAEERRQAWLEAQKEKLNKNGYRCEPSPISTRTAEEAARTLDTPDAVLAPSHSVTAGTGSRRDYVTGSVRDRLETASAKKRDAQESAASGRTRSPAQIKSDQEWLEWNEAYRRNYGHYPPHGI